MESYMMQALAKHATGEATFTIPANYWISLRNNGTEVTGVTRQGTTLVTDIVSSTELGISNASAVVVPTASAGTADEAVAYDASSGGNLCFRFPFDSPLTLTAGATKTFLAGGLRDTWDNTTPTAP